MEYMYVRPTFDAADYEKLQNFNGNRFYDAIKFDWIRMSCQIVVFWGASDELVTTDMNASCVSVSVCNAFVECIAHKLQLIRFFNLRRSPKLPR